MDAMRVLLDVEVKGVGEAVAQARRQQQLSQDAVGDLIGMSGATISRIEAEEAKGVPLRTLLLVLRALKLDPEIVLGEWVGQVPGIMLGD